MSTLKLCWNGIRFKKPYKTLNQEKKSHFRENTAKNTAAEYRGFGINTEIIYKVFGTNAQKAVGCALAEINRLENKLSRFIPDSEVSRLNQSGGKGTLRISTETYKVLSCGIRYSELTQGMFNILTGPLTDLWNYKHATDVPEEDDIERVLSLVDYHDLILDARKRKAGLSKQGQSIDLGGIGKGYAGDRCMEILQKKGIVSAYINIGGGVSVLGNKPDGSPWRVGIRHPRNFGSLLGSVEVTGKAVVTSGDYERYFIDREGKRRHHILNPVTGYPAETELTSVTVVADSAMEADALSTSIFAAGISKGLDYLAHSHRAEAVLVDRDQQVYITGGLEECFHSAEGIKTIIIGKEQRNEQNFRKKGEK